MILNRVKLERVVVFINYIASVVSLTKILIWNKMVLPDLKSPELIENELEQTDLSSWFYFSSDLSRLKVNTLETNN